MGKRSDCSAEGLGLAMALLALLANPAEGRTQTLDGRVLEEGRGRTVQGATVALVGRDGNRRAATVSDMSGRFILVPPSQGEYYIEAEAFGYLPTRSPLFQLGTEGRVSIEVAVTAAPVGLEGLEVEVEPEAEQLLQLFGLTPERLGPLWIGREDLEKRPQSADAIQTIRWGAIPGVQVAPRPNPHDPPELCVMFRPWITCAPVYLNGVKISAYEAVHFGPGDLEAVAVLPPMEAATFLGTEGGAGAVMLWTRSGR